MLQVRENKTDFTQKQWELFDCEVYLEEVSDVLCIAYSGKYCCDIGILLRSSDNKW